MFFYCWSMVFSDFIGGASFPQIFYCWSTAFSDFYWWSAFLPANHVYCWSFAFLIFIDEFWMASHIGGKHVDKSHCKLKTCEANFMSALQQTHKQRLDTCLCWWAMWHFRSMWCARLPVDCFNWLCMSNHWITTSLLPPCCHGWREESFKAVPRPYCWSGGLHEGLHFCMQSQWFLELASPFTSRSITKAKVERGSFTRVSLWACGSFDEAAFGHHAHLCLFFKEDQAGSQQNPIRSQKDQLQ